MQCNISARLVTAIVSKRLAESGVLGFAGNVQRHASAQWLERARSWDLPATRLAQTHSTTPTSLLPLCFALYVSTSYHHSSAHSPGVSVAVVNDGGPSSLPELLYGTVGVGHLPTPLSLSDKGRPVC